MHGVMKDNARTTRLGNEPHTPARGNQVALLNFLKGLLRTREVLTPDCNGVPSVAQ
jgi:hypothetical protein